MNEQITKQYGIEHKPKPDMNTYVYVGGLSVFGLAIGGYLLYSKLKKPEQNSIDVPPPSNISNGNTKIEPKRDILKCSKKFLSHNIYMAENYPKDLKESVYHGAVVSALAICYTRLGKH